MKGECVLKIFGLIALSFLFLTAISYGATLTVTSTADIGAGTLRDTIAAAASGDIIVFSLAGCPCTISLTSGSIVISNDLYILGLGTGQLTISGSNSIRPFWVS